MSGTTCLVGLYTVAFALEAGGIGLVVWDVRSDIRSAEELRDEPWPRWEEPRGRYVAQSRGPHAGDPDPSRWKREQQNIRAASAGYSRNLNAVIGILTGNARRRLWGVALIVAGLLAGTAGNILSLYAT